jgi:hydrogenase maturation factor HypE
LPAEIGYHAAAAALSDLAAMAARPVGILASVALGPGDEGSSAPGHGGVSARPPPWVPRSWAAT